MKQSFREACINRAIHNITNIVVGFLFEPATQQTRDEMNLAISDYLKTAIGITSWKINDWDFDNIRAVVPVIINNHPVTFRI